MCPFCDVAKLTVLAEDNLTLTIADKHPASPGHTLILTRRHVSSFFDTSQEEQQAMTRALGVAQVRIATEYRPDGFNVGINIGEVAGQTVSHVHIHLIPRYRGDSPNPRGGIRHCIPGKGSY